MKIKVITVLFILMLISCVTKGNDENIQKSLISDILQRVKEDFNKAESNAIMAYYHHDYFHRGMNYNAQRFVWSDRLTLYNMIDIDILKIEIMGDYAMARLKVTYYDQENSYGPYIEPEHFGDLSYFYYDKGVWKIYGNREHE